MTNKLYYMNETYYSLGFVSRSLGVTDAQLINALKAVSFPKMRTANGIFLNEGLLDFMKVKEDENGNSLILNYMGKETVVCKDYDKPLRL